MDSGQTSVGDNQHCNDRYTLVYSSVLIELTPAKKI